MKTTKEQRAAIESPEPYIACVAGPGSGKTTVLVERIKRLIAEGSGPGRMVCITFTNAAAREIEKRLGRADLFYVGTLHGFVLRLLRDHGRAIHMRSAVSVLAEDDSDDLLQESADELKVKVSHELLRKELAEADPEPLLFPIKGQKPPTGATLVLSHYFRKCIESGVVDFDTILKFGAMILRRFIRGDGNFITHLFWDEVQDSGTQDFEILKLLPADNKFIVGDPDQSIYGFRGARPDLFLREITSRRWHVVKLEKNFRCLPEICASANMLIGHNRARVDKETVPANLSEEGTVERWLNLESDAKELLAMVQAIRKLPENECAVLVRNNALRSRLVKHLQSFGVKVATRESDSLPLDWQKCRALLALLSNVNNDLLFFRWINRSEAAKAFGSASDLRLKALRRGVTMNALLAKEQPPALPERVALPDLPAVLARCGISPESIELVKKAAADLPPDAWLPELSHALGDRELHKHEIGEGVTVATIHAAKGREWDNVFLPAFEEGIIPSGGQKSDLEEERRLAFVAFTRARRFLVVSNVGERVALFGPPAMKEAQPSRFIGEAGLAIA